MLPPPGGASRVVAGSSTSIGLMVGRWTMENAAVGADTGTQQNHNGTFIGGGRGSIRQSFAGAGRPPINPVFGAEDMGRTPKRHGIIIVPAIQDHPQGQLFEV